MVILSRSLEMDRDLDTKEREDRTGPSLCQELPGCNDLETYRG